MKKYSVQCWNCGWIVDERDVWWTNDVPPVGYCKDCWDDKLINDKESEDDDGKNE